MFREANLEHLRVLLILPFKVITVLKTVFNVLWQFGMLALSAVTAMTLKPVTGEHSVLELNVLEAGKNGQQYLEEFEPL